MTHRSYLRPIPRRWILAVVVSALTAAAGAAVAQSASASVTVGIGQQTPDLFTSKYWAALHAPHVRYITPWDTLSDPIEKAALDNYLAAANAAHADVMIGFTHSYRSPRLAALLPTPAQFQKAFRAWRKQYPLVRDWIPWNEANNTGGPGSRHPDRIAAYYNVATKVCPRCNIVAADVLDIGNMTAWVKQFLRYAHPRPRIWGIHNYHDANALISRSTRNLLSLTKGQIWFTETGGLVRFRVKIDGRIQDRHYGIKHAAISTRYVLNLSRISKRITRIYLYHWRAPVKFTSWDSGLMDAKLHPRPGYDALLTWLTAARRTRLATFN
jgi:hypothetical protein